jgi:mRNA interferase YafQ
MRTIRRTSRFKKDFKRELRGKHGGNVAELLTAALILLVKDEALPPNMRDHALTGEWSDHRDCHLHPDLVLIYRKLDAENLDLVRPGSHSELGL